MSPRTPEQNQALREESRGRIVAAALQLFGRHGYDRTSVRMIAAEAGVAQGLLYSHFPSKEELLRAIFKQSMADVQASFAEAAAGDAAASEPQRIITGAFAVLRRNLEFWRLSYAVRMQPAVVAALGDELTNWTAAIKDTLAQALAATGAAQPAIEAAVLFATIDGVAQHYAIDPDHYPLSAVLDNLRQKYGGSGDGHELG